MMPPVEGPSMERCKGSPMAGDDGSDMDHGRRNTSPEEGAVDRARRDADRARQRADPDHVWDADNPITRRMAAADAHLDRAKEATAQAAACQQIAAAALARRDLAAWEAAHAELERYLALHAAEIRAADDALRGNEEA